jgi:thiol-disulfide isomerase/thioredoxin/outer membrane lipoprotein-sorting protein
MSAPAALVRPLLCSLVAALASLAVAHPAAAAKPEVDPKSQQTVDKWGKFVAGLRGFQFDGGVALTIEQQGKKQSQNFVLKFAAERPNKLSFSVEAPSQGGAQIVSDGSDLSIFIKGFNKYGVEKAPETWDAMLQNPLVAGPLGFGNASVVTAALLNEDPAKKLLEKTTAVAYGGVVELDGVKCHLIEATGEDLDWKLWIESGDKPLARQFVPDLAKAFAKMAKASQQKSPYENMKITNTVTFKDWKTDPKFAADAFAFTAPEGVEKADSLMEILSGGRATAEPGPHPLVGQAAPEVKLELLDGGELNLAAFKGKKVVILDFWATWCGPCVQAMPVIDKVAEKFKDQGVVLYAVNLQEEPDEIKKFMEEAKLKVAVALDKDGAVAGSYRAEAIPQTVLIGKDGVVQVVKVGVSPNLEESLIKDLEAILAGKDLAAETLAAKAKKDEAPAKASEDKGAEKARPAKSAEPKAPAGKAAR